jgi:gas vesicle protein
MRKATSFLIGLLSGAVVGGVLALLFAPYAGEELQIRIRDGVTDLVEEGKRTAAAKRLELEAQLESFKRGQPSTVEAEA